MLTLSAQVSRATYWLNIRGAMEQVKKWLSEGYELAAAIKAAIAPMTVEQFAKKYSRPVGTTSKVINCTVAPTPDDLAALSAELGGTAIEWAMLIWKSSKPKQVAAQ